MNKSTMIVWFTALIAGLALVFAAVVFTHPGIEKQLWARLYSVGLLVAWIIVMIYRRQIRRKSEHRVKD